MVGQSVTLKQYNLSHTTLADPTQQQSWAWTMLAPYIAYCPANETRLAWQNFPVLHILNNANINRYSPNDTAQDGSENVGDRIADPSVSNIKDSCLTTNVTGEGYVFPRGRHYILASFFSYHLCGIEIQAQ